MAKLTRDKYLDHDEFKALLRTATTRKHKNAVRDLALLAVGGLSGCRVGELVALTRDRVLLDNTPPLITIYRLKRRKPVLDDIALPATAARYLAVYLETADPHVRVWPISTTQAARVFKHYAKLAGLNQKYSIHALRHYRGLSLYEATHNLELVREALGHANINTTQIYIHTLNCLQKTANIDIE